MLPLLLAASFTFPRIIPLTTQQASSFVTPQHPSFQRYSLHSDNLGSIGIVSQDRVCAVALIERCIVVEEAPYEVWVWDITSKDMESGTLLVRCLLQSRLHGYPVRFMHTVDPRYRMLATSYFNS